MATALSYDLASDHHRDTLLPMAILPGSDGDTDWESLGTVQEMRTGTYWTGCLEKVTGLGTLLWRTR